MFEIISSEGSVLFEGCVFNNNRAKSLTPNLFINMASNITINGCKFLNSVDYNSSTILKGYFIQIIAESSLYINNSIFQSGYAMYGGAIYMIGEASLFVVSTTFLNNTATRRGGAICAESFNVMNITDSCLFA